MNCNAKTEKILKTLSFSFAAFLGILTYINTHKDKYAATPEDRQALMDEIMAVINAYDKVVGFEHYLPKMLEKILR